MMSRYSAGGRVPFRWICSLFTIMAFALPSLLPIGAAAQGVGNPPVFTPGLHELTLTRAGEPGSPPPSFLRCTAGSGTVTRPVVPSIRRVYSGHSKRNRRLQHQVPLHR